MAYCAICGHHHDPDVGHWDVTSQVIRDLGMPRARRRHARRRPARARRTWWPVVLFILGGILFGAALILVASWLEHLNRYFIF